MYLFDTIIYIRIHSNEFAMFCGYNIEVSTREYLKIQRTHQEEEEKHRKKYKNKKKTSFL